MALSRGASAATRLTRSTHKKMRATASGDSGAGASSHAEDASGDEKLLQEYEAFQHGLAPAKRRRVSSARSRSGSVVSVVSATSESDSAPSADATISKEADAPVVVVVPKEDEPTVVEEEKTEEKVETKPETEVAEPVVAIAEVELASEEKALDGAPEGELYVVTVLTSEEIQQSADVGAERKEIEEVLAAKQTSATADSEEASARSDELSWAKEYAALDSIRRLALHHSEQLKTLLQETSVMATVVCPAAMNLRSAMARNALLCIQDIVQASKRDAEQFFGDIVPLLVQRTGNEKQFIRDLARDVLLTCIELCPGEELLSQLLRISTTEKNSQIVSSAGVYAQKCMEKMDKGELKTIATSSRASFFDEMSAFLNCKVVECKVSTRQALQSLRKTLGDSQFTALVKSKLEGTAQFELLKASEQKRPTIAKSGLPKLSMRERMLQMKKQQAAIGAAAGEAKPEEKDGDVVVVAMPATDATR